MAETSLNDIDPRLFKQVETAVKAMDSGNPAYATEICLGVLSRHPECTDIRKIMRKAQRKLALSVKKGAAFFNQLGSLPAVLKAKKLAKTDAKAGLEAAEKVLNKDPNNAQALEMVAQLAASLEYPNAAVDAWETLRKIKPEDMNIVLALGYAMIAAGRGNDAVKCGDIILQKNPGSGEAQDLVRKASVAVSMEKGKWEGSAKENINKETQMTVENASLAANDPEMLRKLVGDTKAKLEKEPDNINYWRDLARYLRFLEQYDEALEAIEKARALPMGRGDTTLEKTSNDIKLAKMRKEYEVLKEKLDANPDDALKATVEKMGREIHEFRMAQTKELVEKYPNDLNYRHELGMLLYEDGKYDEAIREFQLARSNPKVRMSALLFLGRSYVQKRFYDLAVEQLQTAKKENALIDDTKKEIVYELASCYEKMGQEEKAIAEFKFIYSNDSMYRDVDKKINDYYAKKQQGA